MDVACEQSFHLWITALLRCGVDLQDTLQPASTWTPSPAALGAGPERRRKASPIPTAVITAVTMNSPSIASTNTWVCSWL